MLRVGFLLIDGFAMMSTAAAMEPLRAANLFAERTLYEIVPLSIGGTQAASSLPATFSTRSIAEEPGPFDIVFVVAGGDPLEVWNPELFAWLRKLDDEGTALGGISGGAVILAAAGLMENRRFTVHWHYMEDLGARPGQHLLERRLFVIDRDRYTCAGGTAPLDMMYAIISSKHGARFAQRISDWFIQTEIRVADAPQQASLLSRYGPMPALVADALELMETHIADPLELSQIAALIGISPRQLQRRFQSALGSSVMQHYRTIRLETARTLLSQSGLSVGEIALMTGFATQAAFADVYRRHFDETPGSTRRAEPSKI
ncbi:GlxA family transcriptional regulator [Labrenzia sp. CE80]|uniref:GlxA family transcriptional regulator n=1 Tax=Labrenzia sp. CE80 TaxID=1788986 RepID=UPI00129A416C|nr:GlxA family transcriptional regulator [Labrenzia sp. CE80]